MQCASWLCGTSHRLTGRIGTYPPFLAKPRSYCWSCICIVYPTISRLHPLDIPLKKSELFPHPSCFWSEVWTSVFHDNIPSSSMYFITIYSQTSLSVGYIVVPLTSPLLIRHISSIIYSIYIYIACLSITTNMYTIYIYIYSIIYIYIHVHCIIYIYIYTYIVSLL